jgi:hypothetical protein
MDEEGEIARADTTPGQGVKYQGQPYLQVNQINEDPVGVVGAGVFGVFTRCPIAKDQFILFVRSSVINRSQPGADKVESEGSWIWVNGSWAHVQSDPGRANITRFVNSSTKRGGGMANVRVEGMADGLLVALIASMDISADSELLLP